MRQKTIELAVGLLMLGGIAAISFLAIQVTARGFSQGGASYGVAAYFSNASGLTSKARVTLAGVTIGQVKSIEVVPATMKAKVELNIDEDVNYLSNDSTAVIQTAGILGEKYVAIYPGSADEMLAEGSEIYDTQSSLILEDLIGKLVTSLAAKK